MPEIVAIGECMIELFSDEPIGSADTFQRAYAGDTKQRAPHGVPSSGPRAGTSPAPPRTTSATICWAPGARTASTLPQ